MSGDYSYVNVSSACSSPGGYVQETTTGADLDGVWVNGKKIGHLVAWTQRRDYQPIYEMGSYPSSADDQEPTDEWEGNLELL